jgi:hypothetical protein
MFEISNDIYFIVYNFYFVGQNDNLETRARPIYRDGESRCFRLESSFRVLTSEQKVCIKNIIESCLA